MNYPFPFLRLPYLALDKCIKLNCIADQFALSKVSKRSQRLVKCVLGKRKYGVALDFEADKLKVDINAFNDKSSLSLLSLDASTDVDLIKISISQLTNTFAVKDISIEFWKRHIQLISVIIPFVKQLGVPYGVAVYTNDVDKKNDEICKFILKECGDANTLDLDIPTTPDFSPDSDHFGPFQCGDLKLRNSSWVTTRHLLEWFINCRHILLDECELTRSGVNQLLKTWRKGSKLESIALYYWMLDFTLEGVLNGIPATPAEAVHIQRGSISMSGSFEGFIIQQENGQPAFVHQTDDDNLFMTTKFQLEKEDK